MNIYTCKSFKGYFPVGTAAVVVAKDREEAALALSYQLAMRGLGQVVQAEQMLQLVTDVPQVIILADGEY